eukprot:15435953-Alexandrium_andersonii.AAC.1
MGVAVPPDRPLFDASSTPEALRTASVSHADSSLPQHSGATSPRMLDPHPGSVGGSYPLASSSSARTTRT